ncbi:MAG TPA: BTAD domain-containing putative transcriptional regulator [Actinocrinis sp.]|nr:BTAD domain-containing putative transcriptional regulator [Actinocrinis sp.]
MAGVDSRTVRIRLLGPVDVTVDGAARPLSGLRRKAVLAVIALHPGEPVSTDRLIDLVWGQSPPATAANTLQSHVSHLRRVLEGPGTILTRPPGYQLGLPAEATDAAQAEALIRGARLARDPAATAERLTRALQLWRGRSLADATEVAWLAEQADRLDQLRLDAVQSLVEARLALGEHAHVLPELEQLAEQHPYREQIHGQLMLALYRSGRQADALAAYKRVRQTVQRDLGIDPGPALRELEAAILRQDSSLDAPRQALTATTGAGPGAAAAAAPRMVPAQLPLAAATFVGREAELAHLRDVLAAAEKEAAAGTGSVTVAAVSGTAGVGKTALAVYWAHQVAGRFPDGQLYVNMRGFSSGGQAAGAPEVIRGFLDALGVPFGRVPVAPDAQAGLYRSMLAGRRILIVIDNARDEEQVRPLLPGAPGCFVVVTSRNRLDGLVAAEGAHPLGLELPSVAEARELLGRRLGRPRVDLEPAAVDEIIARCARLPLALAVAAARAAARTGFPLAALAAQLREAGALDPFHGTDAATDVRAVFSWSYNELSARAARLFRQLGLYLGPDLSADAAASLAGLPAGETEVLLDELTQAHLLAETEPRRYAFHDLLRAYAIEQGRVYDHGYDRQSALRRLLDHYLHTSVRAALLLSPARIPLALAPVQPGVLLTELADADQAVAWFAAERPVIFAAVALPADEIGWQGWQLAWTLTTFLDRHGYWHDNASLQEAVLKAATRAGDEVGQAQSNLILGAASVKLGRFDEAVRHTKQALRLYQAIGDRISEVIADLNLSWISELRGDSDAGLAYGRVALRLAESAGYERGRALALNSVGWSLSQLGSFASARPYVEQAIALLGELGDQSAQANAWDSLGRIHFGLGEPEQGAECYRRAIAGFQEIGDRNSEADSYSSLGDRLEEAGDLPAARRAWQRAATLFDHLQHPASGSVRAKLETAAVAAASAAAAPGAAQQSGADWATGGGPGGTSRADVA